VGYPLYKSDLSSPGLRGKSSHTNPISRKEFSMKSRKVPVISAAILALLVISAGCTWVSNENLSLKLMNKAP
jgi:hypothetical protein